MITPNPERPTITGGTTASCSGDRDVQAEKHSVLELSWAARRWAESDDLDAVLHDVVFSCCRLVRCHSAAIAVTTAVPVRPVQVRAASHPDEFATLLDIVSRVPHSPGLKAAALQSTVICSDLAAECRSDLVDFARQTVQRTPIRATTAFALVVRGKLVGVMNLYAERAHGLDGRAHVRAAALADLAAIAISSRATEHRAIHLEVALRNSRTIGAAIGILVERRRVTQTAAFEMLRETSQRANRKLHVLAEEIVATGVLPD